MLKLDPKKIPLSLYIHTPWCIQKCPYCDFNSHAVRGTLPEKNYIHCLIKDFQKNVQYIQGRPLHSIFIGGGTPSLFEAESYAELFRAIKTELDWEPNMEVTLEANPGAAEGHRFQGYREAGINRISVGIQSFQNAKLKTLGRIHNDEQAFLAIESAYTAGIENINIDLMHGLPEQSIEDALYDLTTGLKMNTPHLSWYQLTIEPNTFFYQKPPLLPADDLLWDIQTAGQALLQQYGRKQYEVSAYALPGFYCRHNMNYWEFGDYIGIGAGAHGKVTNFKNQSILRYSNLKHPKNYMQSSSNIVELEKIISLQELPLEFMMNALRLNKPIPISLFEQRTGREFANIRNTIQIAIDKELLEIIAQYLVVTTLGKKFLNELLEIFLPAANA